MNKYSLKVALQKIITDNSQRVFIIDSVRDKTYTFSEFNDMVLRMCSLLNSKADFKAKRVCVVTDSSFDTVVLYFALLYTGAVTIPVNAKSKTEDIAYIYESTESDCVLSKFDIVDFSPIDYSNYFDYTPMTKEPFYDFEEDSISVIMHSSGTTSRPKGIMHSLSNLYKNAKVFSEMVGIDSSNRFLNYLSLTYFGGYYNLLFLPFFSGASVVLSKQFDVSMLGSLSKTIEKYNVNTLWLVPAIMSIMNRFDRSSSESLEIYKKNIDLALVGTAPLSSKLKKSFEDKYDIYPLENYGLSETFFISTNTRDTKCSDGAVGKVLQGVEIEIAEDGEIIVSSEYLTQGYIGHPDDASNILDQKRYKTGDIGHMKDGLLYIDSRKKDLIIRGGENISPKEIENVLLQIDGVDEVAVVGVEHELYGEDIIAFISGRGVESELQRNAKELCSSTLDTKKVPSRIVLLESLPKNASGKIDKNKLKNMFAKVGLQ